MLSTCFAYTISDSLKPNMLFSIDMKDGAFTGHNNPLHVACDIHAQVGGEGGKPKLKSLGFEFFSPPKSKPRLPPWGLKMAKGDADPTEATFSLSMQTKLIDLTHA